MKQAINSVLLIRPDAMGDFISIIPVIKSLRRAWPMVHITVLGSTANQGVVAYVSFVDKFINATDYMGRYWELVKQIRLIHIDVACVFCHNTPWVWLPILAGIPIRIGDKYRLTSRYLFNAGVWISNADHSQHVVDYNLMYLRCLGITDYDKTLTIDLLENQSIFPGLPVAYVVLHVGALGGSGGRSWTPEAYAAIINRIHEQTLLSVVLTGQQAFAVFTQHILELVVDSSRVISLIEKTTLPQLISVLKQAKAYIGTDTGVTHLAAACSCPCVFIMGIKAIKPIRWYPYGVPVHIVRTTVHCPDVCYFSKCHKLNCLAAISTDSIIKGLLDLIAGKHQLVDAFQQSMSLIVFFKVSYYQEAKDLVAACQHLGMRAVALPESRVWHFLVFWQFCITEDVTIFHVLPHVSFLTKIVLVIYQKLLALALFVEPLYVSIGKLPAKGNWIDYYQQEFRALSEKANRKEWNF